MTSTLTHQINNVWQVKGILSYQGYDTHLLSSLRPNSGNTNPITPTNTFNNLVAENGDWTRGVQQVQTSQDYALAEIDLTGNFNTGNIKHTLLLGADADRSSTNTLNYKNITNYDKINIFNPTIYLG